jgi:hypothetical protein
LMSSIRSSTKSRSTTRIPSLISTSVRSKGDVRRRAGRRSIPSGIAPGAPFGVLRAEPASGPIPGRGPIPAPGPESIRKRSLEICYEVHDQLAPADSDRHLCSPVSGCESGCAFHDLRLPRRSPPDILRKKCFRGGHNKRRPLL